MQSPTERDAKKKALLTRLEEFQRVRDYTRTEIIRLKKELQSIEDAEEDELAVVCPSQADNEQTPSSAQGFCGYCISASHTSQNRLRFVIDGYGERMTRQQLARHWLEWTLEDLEYIFGMVHGRGPQSGFGIIEGESYIQRLNALKQYLYDASCKICGQLSHVFATSCPKVSISEANRRHSEIKQDTKTSDTPEIFCRRCELYGHFPGCQNNK